MEQHENTDRWVDDRIQNLGPESAWQPDVARGLALLRKNGTALRGSRRTWTWVITGLVVTSVSVTAFPSSRAFAARCASACVSGSARFLDLFGARPPAPVETRTPAPDFALSDATGKSFRLSDFRGRPVLLNFWATWCLPCKVEIPWFMEFQRANPDLVVLGISLDEEGWAVVKPFLDEKKINYRVAVSFISYRVAAHHAPDR
jgi:thiol-disulfide isomerase/thioredoxin